MTDKKLVINEQIKQSSVLVVAAGGKNLGKMLTREALSLAKADDLDLVMVSPDANPPVCKLMDYRKHLFEKQKSKLGIRKRVKRTQLKEIKFRPGTDTGDYEVKLHNLKRFLADGHKTKITVRFRGREMAHQEIGVALINRVKEDLEGLGRLELDAKMEGNRLSMVYIPVPTKEAAKNKVAQLATEENNEADKDKATEVKGVHEVKFRVRPDRGDYDAKVRSVKTSLQQGHGAKIVVRFRSSEMSNQQVGLELMARIKKDIGNDGKLTQEPAFEENRLIMLYDAQESSA